jgi:carboxyl-terminal processing protease
MRACLIPAALLLGGSFLEAAPLPSAQAERSRTHSDVARSPGEARAFAVQLLNIVNQIAEQYVRPVSHADLTEAALRGLYEAARLPVPADLGARIRQADTRSVPSIGFEAGGLPGGGGWSGPVAASPLFDLVRKVRLDVGEAESLQGQVPLLICCQAMARTLDPHSGIVTASEQRRTLDQECDGVGLELEENAGAGPVLIRAVQLGGPAQRAGLRPSDEIVRIDGKLVRGQSSGELLLRLNQAAPSPPAGPPGGPDASVPLPSSPAPVKVTFRHADDRAERTTELQRERFRAETVLGVSRRDDNSWNYEIDTRRHIAHVRLATLAKGTPDDLREVLSELHSGGMRGLILDLRWCPGGFLAESVEVAGLFLGSGPDGTALTVATVRARGKEDTVYRSINGEGGEGKFRDLPLIVLINGETSGGAELIAAALQDHGRARVAGQRSRGKGSVQTPVPLPGVPQVGMKLTTGTFLRPSGKNLHRFPESRPSDDWGVCPDTGLEFRISADLSAGLKRWWLDQGLRPGASNKRLPLDDPLGDPQRQAALAALLAQLDGQARARAE